MRCRCRDEWRGSGEGNEANEGADEELMQDRCGEKRRSTGGKHCTQKPRKGHGHDEKILTKGVLSCFVQLEHKDIHFAII